jgi:hypothetical protein
LVTVTVTLAPESVRFENVTTVPDTIPCVVCDPMVAVTSVAFVDVFTTLLVIGVLAI